MRAPLPPEGQAREARPHALVDLRRAAQRGAGAQVVRVAGALRLGRDTERVENEGREATRLGRVGDVHG